MPTRLRATWPGIRFLVRESFPKRPARLWGLLSGYQGFFEGSKRPGHEFNHPPPLSAEIKNQWSFTSTVRYALMTRTKKILLLPSPNVWFNDFVSAVGDT